MLPSGFFTSHCIRMTRSCAGRQGRIDTVELSGTRNRSEYSTPVKPKTALASNEMPSSTARRSSDDMIAIFFSCPFRSQ